jgi:hypothetical protein
LRKFAIFALVSLALIVVVAWLLTLVFPTVGDRRAIEFSAVIAYLVQLSSFTIARAFAATNVIAGWGLGMLIRFAVLVIYAFAGVKVLGLPVAAALVSLAAFFFVSTLIEPVLLKP